jgi:hypothetical protein
LQNYDKPGHQATVPIAIGIIDKLVTGRGPRLPGKPLSRYFVFAIKQGNFLITCGV